MQMRRNILLAVLAIALMLPQVSMAKETGTSELYVQCLRRICTRPGTL